MQGVDQVWLKSREFSLTLNIVNS